MGEPSELEWAALGRYAAYLLDHPHLTNAAVVRRLQAARNLTGARDERRAAVSLLALGALILDEPEPEPEPDDDGRAELQAEVRGVFRDLAHEHPRPGGADG